MRRPSSNPPRRSVIARPVASTVVFDSTHAPTVGASASGGPNNVVGPVSRPPVGELRCEIVTPFPCSVTQCRASRLWSPERSSVSVRRWTPRPRIGSPTRFGGSSDSVLKELADLDNPMRTLVGDEPGEDGVLSEGGGARHNDRVQRVIDAANPGRAAADEHDPTPDTGDHVGTDGRGSAERARTRHLPSLAPIRIQATGACRFDPDAAIVLYNDRHPDYLLVKADEVGLLDYLATLVAKEYVVYNNPRSSSDDLTEEMVRMLVRVRRHLPKRR